MDYTQYFNQSESAEMVEPNAVFSKPSQFEDKLNEIKKKIAQLRAKANTQMMGQSHN